MSLNDHSTLYEVLDLKPEASPHEIREAYLRIKATYNKDSVALYTLISAEERESTLRQIEEAYDVLSNPDRRREYDHSHGLMDSSDERIGMNRVRAPTGHKIVSIDRIPPMEDAGSGEDLLVPPTTDFSSRSPFSTSEAPLPSASQRTVSVPPPAPVSRVNARSAQPTPPPSGPAPPMHPPFQSPVQPPPAGALRASVAESQASLAREIAAENDWNGSFLKKVREARRISLEEMSASTKITKSYIQAIEEENFSRLPAPVYVRGFVSQIARVLKLPTDKVSAAYMGRFLASVQAKAK